MKIKMKNTRFFDFHFYFNFHYLGGSITALHLSQVRNSVLL